MNGGGHIRGRWARRLALSAATILAAGYATVAIADETIVYTYDELGRLVSVTIVGGPRHGQQVTTAFDPADNRTNYQVAGGPNAILSVVGTGVTEGGTATVTVTRSGSLSGSATVNYATANGSATTPADYTAASGTITFANGEASKTISVSTIDDAIFEGPKTFSVNLSSPSSGTAIANATAVVTIADTEMVPELAISNVSVTEGGAAVLTVTRSGLIASGVSVNYASANGTAVAPGDFGAVSGTLTFASGETSKTITVSTVNDSVHEAPESFTVGLSGATGGAILTNATGRVSVADDDTAPSFAISGASVTEGGAIVMTVTKTGLTAATLSIVYETVNGGAAAPADYAAQSGTLTFLPGETSKTVTVTTVDDTVYEANETLSVRLSGASGGATISTASGTGTINDNDTMPSFSVANVSVTEGGVATVTVTKSGATGANASVAFATAHGTANQTNYTGASGTLTFLPGETAKTIQIATTQDVSFGLTKTFTLGLSSPTAATIGAGTSVVSIIEDDPPPGFALVAPTSENEGTSIRFGVVLTGNLHYGTPLTVNYTTSSGTATSGVDFTATSGTLTFTSPTTVLAVDVPTTQESTVEPDETFTFTLSSPSHGAAIVNGQATGTILNDDLPPSSVVANTDNAGTYARCDFFSVNPLANDTDSSGNYPLTLVSVATGAGYTRTISGNTVHFWVLQGGTRNVQYVVQNAIGGQATGTITFAATSGPICL